MTTKNQNMTYSWKSVASVRNEQAGFTHSSVAHGHALNKSRRAHLAAGKSPPTGETVISTRISPIPRCYATPTRTPPQHRLAPNELLNCKYN